VADKSKIPVAMLDGSCKWVDSRDAAAMAGLESLPAGNKEFSRAIYQRPDGLFCFSEAIPGTESNFAFRLDKAAGKFSGLLHTHPADASESTFSADDVLTANKLGVPSYIRGNGQGQTRRFTPGDPIDTQHIPGSRTRKAGTAQGVLIEPTTRRDQLEASYERHKALPNPDYKE